MKMLDKNNEELTKGDSVSVDAVNGQNFDFLGTVVGTHGEFIVVEDMDGDCFCMLPCQIELEKSFDN